MHSETKGSSEKDDESDGCKDNINANAEYFQNREK